MSYTDAIERINYYNDPRTRPPAQVPVLTTETTDEPLPYIWEVCPVCSGKGSHVNPAIDAGGLSLDYDDDPEFLEDYQRGVYDVPCNHCRGRTTVPAVDWDALTPEQRAGYEQQLRWDAEYDAERRAELIAGC